MTVSKRCKKCGDMMRNVHPYKRFCDACIKEKARQKAKLNYEKKKAQQQGVISAMQAKKPDKKVALKPRIKSIEQCVREAAALGISYGQYVQRGYDKITWDEILRLEVL